MTSRATFETCASCAWFDQGAPSLATATHRPAGSDPEAGTCIVRPPRVIKDHGMAGSYWPETRSDRRACGSYVTLDDPDDGEREDIPETVVPFCRKVA